MTELTSKERSGSTRLGLLHTICEDLSNDENDALRAYLIGALSAECAPEVWDSCLESALHLVELDRARKVHPSADPSTD